MLSRMLLQCLLIGALVLPQPGFSQKKQTWKAVPTTYCNPMNLDYAYVPSRHTYYGQDESHRSTADPVIVNYKGDLFLFSTNQQGYWWSDNHMATWHFVSHNFRINRSNDDVCAPAAWAFGDTMLFMPSHMDYDRIPMYVSTDPKSGKWEALQDSFPQAHNWDPAIFKDDDDSAYLFWGSSNFFPLYGEKLNPGQRYEPTGKVVETLRLHPDTHGWERFGDDNRDSTIMPYTEGSWMTKHNGKYYLQYGAPGTEFNVYADGVYEADQPLGPYTYAPYNPFSLKTGGFATGAGHGSTFQDAFGNYWHVATMLNWIKYKFERRLGVFPAGFDGDQLYTHTAFGDYPHYLPTSARDHRESTFTGWMMLSWNKPCVASSSLPGKPVTQAFDENIRSYWSAETANPGEFVQVDLGQVCTVHALQINYADEDAHLRDKQPGIYHQYRIWMSENGKKWKLLVDKSTNTTDVPHDYVEFIAPAQARYLKLENVHMADGKFAVAGFRVFGKAPGAVPSQVADFQAKREPDTRNVHFSWKPVEGAYAYQIYWGITPDKLHNCLYVTGDAYEYRGLTVGQPYYARIEPLGETGVGAMGEVVAF